jgi:hypothetical protein
VNDQHDNEITDKEIGEQIKAATIIAGDAQVCQLHFDASPDGRYGTLIDPNGHRWHICSECINSLWTERQPRLDEDAHGILTDAQLDQIVELMVRLGYVAKEREEDKL